MSFSSDIKQELNKANSLSNKENVKFELIGYFISGNTSVVKGRNIKFSTESDYNINRFSKLLSNLGINHDIDVNGKTFNIVTKSFDIKKLEFLELQENEQLSKYIRIDYAPNDYKEIIHTKCHLHIGIDKNEFRIPVQTIIYPKEFIYFILKYIYHEDSKFTSLISLNNEKEILLTDKEINKLRLIIG